MSKYAYRIYPSVLNSFQRLLDSDIDAEDFSNVDSVSGDYRRSADEIYAEREQDLLNLINRVQREPIEAADRGTAFNEIIDCIIEHRPCNRDDIQITHIKKKQETHLRYLYGGDNTDDSYVSVKEDIPESIEAKMNGFVFKYDPQLCRQTAKYFNGAITQHLCQAALQTHYGVVQLYGYADYIFPDRVVDLKTCSRYDFGKYQHNWQKELYPYCLIQSGDMQECSMFEFYVVQLKNPTLAFPLITGNDYREEYNYDHTKATLMLQQICERLIEWLEQHKSQITNHKIFGEE